MEEFKNFPTGTVTQQWGQSPEEVPKDGIQVDTEGLNISNPNPSSAELNEFAWRQTLAHHLNDERKVLESELREMKEWGLASKVWYEHVNGKPFDGTDEEAVQFGIDSMSNLYALFNTDLPWSDEDSLGLTGFVNSFEDAPLHARSAATFLRMMYEDKGTTLAGFLRASRAQFQDPTNAVGVATVVGFLGKAGGRTLVKAGLDRLMRSHMEKEFAKGSSRTAFQKYMGPAGAMMSAEGALYAGYTDYEEQVLERYISENLGNEVVDGYDWKRGMAMSGMGAAFGYGLNRAAVTAGFLYKGAKQINDELKAGHFDVSNEAIVPGTGPLDRPLRLGNRTQPVDPEAVKSLIARYPQAEPLIPFLNAREIQLLDRPRMKQRVDEILLKVAEFEEGDLSKEIQSLALAGEAKKGWYRESGQLLLEVFGDDFPRFAALLAGTSPRTSVQSNLKNALTIWRQWDEAGRPTDEESIMRIMADSVEGEKGADSVMDAWVNNTVTALTEPHQALLLSGNKVDSFMRNIMGDSDAVTLDSWMAKYFGIDQKEISGGGRLTDRDDPGLNAMYQAASIIVRKGAQKLTNRTGKKWSSAEIQETVWSFVRTAYEMRRKGDQRTIDQIIKSGEITPDVLSNTDDFATLLGADDIGALLKGTHYGRRLEQAIEQRSGTTDAGQGTTTQVSGGSVKPTSRHLVGVGKRLERDYRDNAITGVVARIRKSLDLSTPSRLDGEEVEGVGQAVVRDSKGRAGAFTKANRFNRANKLGRVPYQVYTLAAKHAAKLNNIGRATPPLVELERGSDAATVFIEKIIASKQESQFGPAVHVYEPDEYAAMRLFSSKDGTSGFAIKDDGDIVSVFNLESGPHSRITPHMLALAIEQGGRKLDCFETQLPRIYSESGFRVVARTKWNEDFKSADWDKELFLEWNNGEPDIVYMIYDPKYVAKGKNEYKMGKGGKVVADPDEAAAIQAAELKKLGLN